MPVPMGFLTKIHLHFGASTSILIKCNCRYKKWPLRKHDLKTKILMWNHSASKKMHAMFHWLLCIQCQAHGWFSLLLTWFWENSHHQCICSILFLLLSWSVDSQRHSQQSPRLSPAWILLLWPLQVLSQQPLCSVAQEPPCRLLPPQLHTPV